MLVCCVTSRSFELLEGGAGRNELLHLGRKGSLWPTHFYFFYLTLLFYTVSTFPFLTPTVLVRLLFIPFFLLI